MVQSAMSLPQHSTTSPLPASAAEPERKERATTKRSRLAVSPKVTAAGLGGALATLMWVPIGHFIAGVFSQVEIASMSGATATVLATAVGYVVHDPARIEA